MSERREEVVKKKERGTRVWRGRRDRVMVTIRVLKERRRREESESEERSSGCQSERKKEKGGRESTKKRKKEHAQ